MIDLEESWKEFMGIILAKFEEGKEKDLVAVTLALVGVLIKKRKDN